MVAELAELINEGRAKLIGLVRQELLSGMIRTSTSLRGCREVLRSFPRANEDPSGQSRASPCHQRVDRSVLGCVRGVADEPVQTPDYEAAAAAGNQCRSEGLAVSVSDMLICAVAQARGWTIFSADPDFKRYSAVLRLKLHSVRK